MGAPAAGTCSTSVVVDSNGEVIGTPGDETEAASPTRRLQPASVPLAPLPRRIATSVRCGAFWYNDFGLEHTFVHQNPGQIVWYSWAWNRSPAPAQCKQARWADRRPLLGWYRGDDRNVLSWQAKWLVEAGVGFVICQQGGGGLPDSSGAWEAPGDVNHWLFQLMTVPAVAASLLRIVFWLPHTDAGNRYKASAGDWHPDVPYQSGQTVSNVRFDNRQYTALQDQVGRRPDQHPSAWRLTPMPQAWTAFVKFYARHQARIETVVRKGRVYALAYIWAGEDCRSQWGTGAYLQWLKALGAALHDAVPQWEGICVLVRQSTPPSRCDGVDYPVGALDFDDLEAGRCLVLRTDYIGDDSSHGASGTYADFIRVFPSYRTAGHRAAERRRVLCAPTALQSVPPHPSNYGYVGHSPARFQALVAKQVDYALAGRTWPMQLIYNVAEWAEGGPGLQPNSQDGFGYLDALRRALT